MQHPDYVLRELTNALLSSTLVDCIQVSFGSVQRTGRFHTTHAFSCKQKEIHGTTQQ